MLRTIYLESNLLKKIIIYGIHVYLHVCMCVYACLCGYE